jgi:diguanylate cyclase (GGDEF)-like protein
VTLKQLTDSDAAFVDAVLSVQSLVSASASQEVIYQAVVDNAVRLLGVESGALRFVDRRDPSWTVAVATAGGRRSERWRPRAPITEGLSGRVIASGQPLIQNEFDRATTRSQLAPTGLKAGVGVPIRERGRVIGSISLGTQSPSRRFTEQDLRLASEYADHVGVVLTVARADYAMQQAFTDTLTGLGNRALLLDRLEHELVRSDRGGAPVTVLFIDLDRFKLVNDSLGHIAGDQLLMHVADRLRGCLRDDDVCARLGGDEFAILLAGARDPDTVADRIIDVLQRRFSIDGQEVFIGVSVGIATGREEAETLLRNADVAMYHAKRGEPGSVLGEGQGRDQGRRRRFEPEMHEALVSRLGLDSELRRAVERGEFELHYQPLYDLRSGRIAAFEALVRWRHPARGLVPPLEFIPLAEETGMIVEIGQWVLEHACAQLATWYRQAPLAMSVNASIRELQQTGYAGHVERAIGGAFPPSALVIEVTESARLQDAPSALTSLHAVKELGARTALDDFGTGYATLINLSHLPVDALKVAKPFVDAIGGTGRNPSGLLAGILALGRHLDLTTVAEGIEHPHQRELLVALGCDLGQGYLLSRPLDASAATERLAADRAEDSEAA